MKTSSKKLHVVILFCLLLLLCFTCKKDDSESSSTPEIVGCNSVKYKGMTFSNIGCSYGIESFDTDICQNGTCASFHVTCSGGCVSSVTVR